MNEKELNLMYTLKNKSFFSCVFFLLISCSLIKAESFSARIIHVDATNFPVVEAMLQISPQRPIEIESSDLQIQENTAKIEKFSLEPQNFNHFIALTIDRSSSIESAMPDVKKAALKLIKNLAGEVSFAVISFGSDIDYNQNFTKNIASLSEAVLKIRPWGGTALFDALHESVDELQAAAGINDLKTIICITDGHDSTPSGQTRLSHKGPEDVLRFALDKNIRIITIGLGDDIDEKFLSSIASETGGWYLQTATSNKLTRMSDELSRRIKLRKHFKLVFNSPDLQNLTQSRRLQITIRKNSFENTAIRSFHIPTRVSSMVAAVDKTPEVISIEELLDFFEIYGIMRSHIVGKIRVPAAQAVFGLTTAAFSGLNELNARNLINITRQRIAREHEINFQQQKSAVDVYLNTMDQLLKHFYTEAEKPGLKQDKSNKIASLLEFLQLRREELDLQQQKIYESYLLRFKASADELAFFERTQVANEKLSDDFFAANSASCTAALEALTLQIFEKLTVIEQKKQKYMAKSVTAISSETPQSPTNGVDTGMPRLPQIKTID